MKNGNVDYIAYMLAPNTHNHFMALLDFGRDYPGEPVPER